MQRRFAHGSDIFSALQFKENIENVHELVRKDGYLQEFIKENMIQNNHRLDLVMSPSKDYFEMVQQEEKQRLETTIANLSPAEVEEAKLQEDILTKEQDSNEDLSVLPCLALSDVKANNQIYPVDNIHLEQSLVTFRETITNGISYLKVKFDLSQISDDLLPYLSIFARALTSMGTSKLSHSQFEEEIRLIGSISANVGSLTAPNSLDIEKTYLQFNCYAKDSNINHLYEKLGQALLDANFKDTNTFEMIVKEDLAGLKSSIVDSGSAYAARAAAAHLTESGRKNELLYGFKQISFLEKLVQSNDAHKELEQLEKIRKHLLVAERSAFVVCESPIKSRHIEQLQTLFNEIPRTKDQVSSSTKISALESSTLIGHNMDLGVNYIAQSIKTVPYIHADSPHLMVL